MIRSLRKMIFSINSIGIYQRIHTFCSNLTINGPIGCSVVVVVNYRIQIRNQHNSHSILNQTFIYTKVKRTRHRIPICQIVRTLLRSAQCIVLFQNSGCIFPLKRKNLRINFLCLRTNIRFLKNFCCCCICYSSYSQCTDK